MADVEIRPARDEDLEPVYEIVAENRIRLFGDVEGFYLEHMRNLSRRVRGSWVATSGSEVVGAAALVLHGAEVDVRLDARRRGIGTRLLHMAEEAATGEVLRADAVDLDPAAAPFLRANGYEKAWEYWLMGVDVAAQPGEPVWPDGVAVRTFRDGDAQPLWNLLELAYAEEEDPYPPFEEWQTSLLGDPSFEHENWFLVEWEDELVAAALNWNDAYVKDLVVHPNWRRRGLGGALLRQTFRHFEARGHPRVSLKTDSINPTEAWRLYKKLGMRKERTYVVFQKRL